MTLTKKLLSSPLTPILVIVLAAAAWLSHNTVTKDSTGTSDRAAGAAIAGQPFYVEAAEMVTSVTAEDWAAAADVVVAGTVVSETALEPPKSETEVGVEHQLIGRSVTVDVFEVLWRSPDATVANPTTFTMDAFGWARSDDGTREVTVHDSSRLEVGHKYVMALVWQPAQCAEGDRIPAAWTWIGAGGVIPADKYVLGAGEVEGSNQTVAETESEAVPDSVEAENVGETITAVKDDLQKADDSGARTWPDVEDNACS